MDWVRKRAQFQTLIPFMLVIALAAFCSIIGAHAEAGDSDATSTVTLDVSDSPLHQVVKMLTQQGGYSIIIKDQGGLRNRTVTATLRDQPIEMVLENVVDSAGAYLSQKANGVWVISETPLQPAVETTKPDAGVASSLDAELAAQGRLLEDAYVDTRNLVYETVKVYNVSALDMMYFLGLYNPSDAAMLKEMQYKPPVYPTKGGMASYELTPAESTPPMADPLKLDTEAQRAQTIEEEFKQFGGGGFGGGRGGGGGFGGGRGGGGGFGGGRGGGGGFGGGRGGGGGFGGGRGGGGFGGGQGGGGFGGGRGGGGFGGGRGGGYSLMPEEGIDIIVPYMIDNSLIVKGTEEAIAELKELIKKLDIAPRQIQIKCEFIQITTEEAKRLGVDWNLERLNVTFDTDFVPSGNVTIGYANGNVLATLKAQLSSSKAKLVNAPLTVVMNNVPGGWESNTTVPYWSADSTVSNGTVTTVYNANFEEVSSGFDVTARINPADNTITLDIFPYLQDLGGFVKGPDGQEAPIIASQGSPALVRVANGETFVIGGVIRKNDTYSETGIPFLKDLPIIGPLFRTTDKAINDTETLVFVTPRILPERNVTGGGVGVGVGPGVGVQP